MNELKRGYTFTHQSFLEPTWHPSRGQKYADAPMAEMVITRVSSRQVWYKFSKVTAIHAGWVMDRAKFIARYGHEGMRNDY